MGRATRKSTCTYFRNDEPDDDKFDNEDEATINRYLPHSLFDVIDYFDFTLTDDETKDFFNFPYSTGSEGDVFTTFEKRYKESFVMFWLTEHHFYMVSSCCDIAYDICELVQDHPAYGMKYLDEFIKTGNNLGGDVALSTLILRDKDRFLGAIACEAPLNTNRYYEIISDAIKSELVTWDEVIPRIARFMGKFGEYQAKFFSSIKDENIKLKLFNEIKKSASFKSGLQNWIDAHKEVNMSIDYLFENISTKEDDWNIELFGYCLHDDNQLLPKALEIGKHFCSKLLTLYNSNMKIFCDKVVSHFIKLNDIECLRKLIEFLLSRQEFKYRNEKTWNTIIAHKESCKLIPYIFDIIKQKTSTLDIKTSILCGVFKLMINCNKQKSTKIQYNLLFNRLNLANVLSVYRYERKMLKVFASKIIQVGDESNLVSLVNQVLESDDWRTAVKSCVWTKSFSNIFCDSFLQTSMKEFITISIRLIRSNIDTNRLESLLSQCSTEGMDVVMKITEAILVCGRADECTLYLFLANYLLKTLEEFNETECNFLLRLVRNDDIGTKFLQAIDFRNTCDNETLLRKHIIVDNLLFKSALNLQSNIDNYSSGFLFRIGSLISFYLDFLKTNKLGSWIYPSDLLNLSNVLRRDIVEFLKQDVQCAEFGRGDFDSIVQAKQEASVVSNTIPDLVVHASESDHTASYTIKKTKIYLNLAKTNSKIHELTSMLTYITSNNDELKDFGLLPFVSPRAPCEDEPPKKLPTIG